MILYFPTSPN